MQLCWPIGPTIPSLPAIGAHNSPDISTASQRDAHLRMALPTWSVRLSNIVRLDLPEDVQVTKALHAIMFAASLALA